MHFEMPYGQGQLGVDVDADLLRSRDVEPVADESAAVEDALANPIGCAPLSDIVKPGETVAIIVNDITRLTRTDLLLPPIVNALNRAGIPDASIFIVFALGIHR